MEDNREYKTEYGGIAFLAAIAASLLIQMIYSFASMGKTAETETDGIILAAFNILLQGGNLAVYFIVSKKFAAPDYRLLKKTPVYAPFLGILLAPVCLFCFYALSDTVTAWLESIGIIASSVSFDKGGTLKNILLIFSTVIAAPICEELVYRGAVLSGLRRRFGAIASAVLSAAAFAIMHMSPHQTVYQFGLGLVCAFLVMSCGSVLPSILLHSFSNLIVVLTEFWDAAKAPFEWYGRVFLAGNAAKILSCIFLTILGVAIGYGIWWLIGRKKAMPIALEKGVSCLRWYFITYGICLFMWITVFIEGIVAQA